MIFYDIFLGYFGCCSLEYPWNRFSLGQFEVSSGYSVLWEVSSKVVISKLDN